MGSAPYSDLRLIKISLCLSKLQLAKVGALFIERVYLVGVSRQIRSVYRSLPRPAMLTLLRPLVINKLDFCGSVMAGATDVLLLRLQSVLNAAVRLVFSARKYDHTTPLLRELHWLKVPERVTDVAYRCLNGTAPHYLAETIHPVTSRGTRQRLRSADTSLCHPHAAQLLAIAHFRRLPHEHGTLCHNRFKTKIMA